VFRADLLPDARELLPLVLETLPVGVWIMDASGKIIYGNAAGQEIWGGARYVGVAEFGEYKGWWADSGEPIAAEDWAAARAIQRNETSINEVIDIQCFDGTRKTILNSALPIRGEQGQVVGAIIVNQDITERRRLETNQKNMTRQLEAANRELGRLSRIDPLTDVANRRSFDEAIEREIRKCRRSRRPLSLVMLDIDHFKRFNDRLGHPAGDRCLQLVANRVATILRRPDDLVARYGGDEFVALLADTDWDGAAEVAETIRSAIASASASDDGLPGPITVSVGMASATEGDPAQLDSLLARADEALILAKQQGRNQVVVASAASLEPGSSATHG
jgi:diguanylate cyclase (GGDEF)-like protein